MKRLILLVAVGALAGCENGLSFPDLRGGLGGNTVTDASDPTIQLSDQERFISAVEANGCIINVDTVAPIMAQASINRDQLATVSQTLEAEGALAPIDADNVKLTSTNCV